MKTRRTTLMLSTATIAALFTIGAVAPAEAQRKSLRFATSAVGSYGYSIAAGLAKVVERVLDNEYTVTVQPYPSPTVGMKAVMDGNGEIAYTADIGMGQFHERVGGFKGYEPKVPPLAHTWYSNTVESIMATSAARAGEFKCWRDFSGKPVFFTNAGFMNWLNWQRIFKALDYDFKHVQIDLSSNADALQSGTVVASTTYTNGGRSLAAYWKETEVRMDIAIINPCPDEVTKLQAAGLSIVDIDPKNAFSKSVGTDVMKGVPVVFGYNMRLDMPEDVVYRFVSGLYKEKDNLVKVDAGFEPLAKDFFSFQRAGINANTQIPVHPGYAKFLKEHNVWDDRWTVGKVIAK